MAPAKPFLAAGLCLLATAACGTGGPAVPAGWARQEIAGCCTLALPPGSSLAAIPDPIDNPGFQIRGTGFEGVAYVQSSKAGPPIATPSPTFTTRELKIDGHQAWLTSYTSTEPGAQSQKRILDWTFDGGGTGRSIHAEFSCDPKTCPLLELALRTLEVQ